MLTRSCSSAARFSYSATFSRAASMRMQSKQGKKDLRHCGSEGEVGGSASGVQILELRIAGRQVCRCVFERWVQV